MKRLDIQAYTVEEAKIIAFQQGITVVKDLTMRWKLKGSPVLTKDLELFAAETLNNMGLFPFKGAGVIIMLSKGVKDTRKSPYKKKKIRTPGRAKLKRVIEIRTSRENKILGEAKNRMEALAFAKKMILKHRENVYAKTIYLSNNDKEFELVYIPSTKAHYGQFVVFYADEGDVRMATRQRQSLV